MDTPNTQNTSVDNASFFIFGKKKVSDEVLLDAFNKREEIIEYYQLLKTDNFITKPRIKSDYKNIKTKLKKINLDTDQLENFINRESIINQFNLLKSQKLITDPIDKSNYKKWKRIIRNNTP